MASEDEPDEPVDDEDPESEIVDPEGPWADIRFGVDSSGGGFAYQDQELVTVQAALPAVREMLGREELGEDLVVDDVVLLTRVPNALSLIHI